jgi:hypothetical protein
MAKYSLDEIQKVWIPKNTRLTFNNVQDAKDRIQIPSNAVGIYDLIKDTIEYLGISITGSNTDISIVHNSSSVNVVSSTGADGTINAATTSLSGVMTATDKINLNALGTLSGVALGSTNLGTFTGTTIPNNVTIKAALQSLETSLDAILVGVPIFGNLTASTTAITVTGGTSAVKGAGTSLTLVPGNILLSTLGGTLNLTQLDAGVATLGDILTFDGTNWAPATTIPVPHNGLSGIQGGTFLHRYHLDIGLYNKLTASTAGKLIGRTTASAGEVEFITPTDSIVMTTTNLALVGDATSPGNSKYYGTNGSGTKGWYTSSTAVSSMSVTDNADIDFTITNPTTTPDITATLTTTGVTPGIYGNSSQVPSLTVDSKGRISNVTNTSISISSSSVSDFSEAVDDRVSALLVAGTNISFTYNDPANTLTINATGSGGGVSGSGGPAEVAYWDFTTGTTLTSSSNFIFDGSNLGVNTNTVAINSILTTKGISGGALSWGYSHLNVSDDIVFTVADNGEISLGDVAANPLTLGDFGITRQVGYYLSTSSGNIQLIPTGIVYVASPMGINTSSVGSNKLKVVGSTQLDLGSDATNDLLKRGASGSLARIPIGIDGDVLTIVSGNPVWAASGSAGLPAGSTGDILVHNGSSYVSVSPITETQSGITGSTMSLATTPLAYTLFTLYRNGIYQVVTDDFTLSGMTITWVTALVSSDKITAIYYI